MIVIWLLLPVVVAYHGLTLAMLCGSVAELRRQRRGRLRDLALASREAGALPAVSIVVPAFNEEATILRTIDSLLALNYHEYEIVVVNDGSTDRTADVLAARFQLRPVPHVGQTALTTERVRDVLTSGVAPCLRVVDKRNGGKADALNAGINEAMFGLVLAIDADVVLDPDALAHLALPFVLSPATIAASGIIRPQNGCEITAGRLTHVGLPTRWLERIQVLEYLRAYGVGRMFFNAIDAHLIVSGAFGLFSRQALIDLGGYQPHSVGEDMELVVRLVRAARERGTPGRIAFSSDALCLTEAPHSWKALGGQRTRWHQGLLSTLRLHRRMIGRSRYGLSGVLVFPYFLLELYYPVVEALGWIVPPLAAIAGVISPLRMFEILFVFAGLGSLVSLAAIAIDAACFPFFTDLKTRLILIGAAALEHCGYHQATIVFRLRAFLRYYRGLQLKTAWQPPRRAAAPADAARSR